MGISVDFENMAKKVQEFASTQNQSKGIDEMVLKLENVCEQACEELEVELELEVERRVLGCFDGILFVKKISRNSLSSFWLLV